MTQQSVLQVKIKFKPVIFFLKRKINQKMKILIPNFVNTRKNQTIIRKRKTF